MVVLRDMTKEEYPAYCHYFVGDYSQELVANYGHSIEYAVELAEKELLDSFPSGPGSSEQSLLCIEAESFGETGVVGYLWHSIDHADDSTFIYDFYVSDECRGRGFGRQAIAVLEGHLQVLGVAQIKLRVAYHNERALKLYEELGFAITGFNMSKKLGSL